MTVLERTNVRDLRPRDLPYRPGAIAADLSFISLGVALPALAACASPDAHFVLLVKPQFEAGRGEVGPGGVVTDPGTWSRVIRAVAESCRSNGLTPVNVMASPLLGRAGNAEFLLWASSGASSDGSAGHTPAPLPEAALDRAVREAIGAIGRSTAAGGGAPRGYRGE